MFESESRATQEIDAAFARTRARINDLFEMTPGPTLLTALMAMRSEPHDAADAVRLDTLWHKFLTWATAQRMIITQEAVNGGGHLDGIEEHQRAQIIAQEIAHSTHLSYGDSATHVGLTLDLASHLPQAWMAMDRTEFSLIHARRLARAVEHCPRRVAEAVDALIVPLAVARGWTPDTVASEAAKLTIRLDPDGAAERAAAKKEDSNVRFYPETDEMASIHARGDAATLRQIQDTIEARAVQLGIDGDERSIGERRIAALADFVLGPDPAPTDNDDSDTGTAASDTIAAPPTQRQRRHAAARRHGEVLVRIDWATLMGLNDNPAELDGYGPITASTARILAKDATWRRLVTDPVTGHLLDFGRTRYVPTAELREFVVERDRTCSMTGCHRPARRSQLDHKVPYPQGPTSADNFQPLCPMHHDLKTKKFYAIDVDADGTEIWRTPLGFTFRKDPSTYLDPELEPPPSSEDLEVEPTESALAALLDADPDPPDINDPLPEAPTITLAEYFEFTDGLEQIAIGAANRFYDDWLSFTRAH